MALVSRARRHDLRAALESSARTHPPRCRIARWGNSPLPRSGVPLTWPLALNDAQLRRIVHSLAHESNEVRARGVTEPDLIARTQKIAADGLAGVPPLPRRGN
jgi:hypothetical protein